VASCKHPRYSRSINHPYRRRSQASAAVAESRLAVRSLTGQISFSAQRWISFPLLSSSCVNVGVQVNMPLPTAEEIAERRAMHARLDKIFTLKRKNTDA